MKSLGSQLFCAALVLASASCIIDRGARSSDDAMPQPPPARRYSPPPAPPPPPPAASSDVDEPAMPAAEPAPSTKPMSSTDPTSPGVAAIKERAQAADDDRATEAQKHGGAIPEISNVDGNGNQVESPSTFDTDDSLQEGAPGAKASPEDLARAWPGAKPFDGVIGGNGNDGSQGPARPTALPYSAPGGSDVDGDTAPPTGGQMGSQMVTNDNPPAPGTEVDPDQFQQPLRSYGRWVTTPDYGRVWIPYVDNDWQPYSDGSWVNTEYGWSYTSYEPWGWAVWHYGNWGYRNGIGWYWVPGRVWGPAWVSWRWGGGYAAWRPIAPWGGGVWGARWGNRGWVGVPAAHFTEPIRTVAVQRAAISVAIAGTHPLAGPVAHPVAGGSFGPPVRAVARVTGNPVVARPAAQVMHESNVAARSAAAQAGRAGAAQQSAPRAIANRAQIPQTDARTRSTPAQNRNRGPMNRNANGSRANRPAGGQHGGGGHANASHGGGGHKRH